MANFKVEEFFNYKGVTPSGLQNDNIVQFSYKSPRGIHDKQPLVHVLEKRSDRMFGVNLHYDMHELQEAVTNTQASIATFLEGEYYKKYPANKQKLREQRIPFNKTLITEAEYKDFMKRYPKKQLEQFLIENVNKDAIRCYLYQRMTAVSLLTWKV